jgi:hypothetical protein
MPGSSNKSGRGGGRAASSNNGNDPLLVQGVLHLVCSRLDCLVTMAPQQKSMGFSKKPQTGVFFHDQPAPDWIRSAALHCYGQGQRVKFKEDPA